MNSRTNLFKTQVLQLIDGFLVWISFVVVALLRNPIREFLGMKALPDNAVDQLGVLLFVAVFLVPILLEFSNFYRKIDHKGYALKEMFMGVMLSALSLLVLMITIKIPIGSRFLFLGVPPLFITLLLIRSWAYHTYRTKTAGRDARKYGVLLVGSKEEAEEFLTRVDEETKLSWVVEEPVNLREVAVDDFVDIIKLKSIARVIFVTRQAEVDRVQPHGRTL